jgi:hypothetical protein
VQRYPRWLLETQTPWVLLGFAAPWLVPHASTRMDGASPRAAAIASLATIFTLLALYLPYVPFADWTYLRFLLPAVVLIIALSSAALVALLGGSLDATRTAPTERRASPWAMAVLAAIACGLASWGFRTADARGAFTIRDSEARFVEAATWVRDSLPVNAVVLTIWHSGSIRYYGSRVSILWDALPAEGLDRAIEHLVSAGRRPYLLLERWERERFQQRFRGSSPLAELDWPPRARIGRDIELFDLADRARYRSGETVQSERVWTAAERRAFGRRF